jgi:hypothetical protein
MLKRLYSETVETGGKRLLAYVLAICPSSTSTGIDVYYMINAYI